MDLFSFTSIIVILFLIIGVYILATGQAEGRAKIVLVIVLLIVFIVVLTNLSLFKSYTTGIDYPTATTDAVKKIGDTDTKYEVSTSYSLSMWIYISDWNNNLGNKKIICQRLYNDNIPSPKLYLDEHKNILKIKYTTFKLGTDNPNAYITTSDANDINVENIPIQKWVNINVCFGDNKIDTYINGKLEKSTLTNNVQYVPENKQTTMFEFTPVGTTFNGYIAKTRYYSRFLGPQECWDIYKDGFSDNIFGNFLNQYNATFKFQKGAETLYEIPLM